MHDHERAWLKQQLALWVEKGIISSQQAESITHQHALNDLAPVNWGKRVSYAVSGLAIFIGVMGVFLLISANWDKLGRYVQMAIVLLPLLASYVVGLRFALRGEADKASLLFFLSSLLLGANIYLQAQIFHIEAYWPDGILWWMVGMVGPMLFFNSNLHGLVVQLLFSFWIGTQFAHNQLTPIGYLVFAALVWQTIRNPFWLMLLYTLGHLLAVLLRLDIYALLLLHPSSLRLPPILGLVALAALLIYLVPMVFHGQYSQRFAQSVQTAALLVLLCLLYISTFAMVSELYIEQTETFFGFVLLGLVALAYWRVPRTWHLQLAAGITAGVVLATLAGRWVFDYNTYPANQAFEAWTMLLANLAFLSIGMIRINYGRLHKRKTEFMAGIAMILILAFTRYLDYIQDYITGGLLFIGCAFLLFYLNLYWDKKYAQP